MKISCSCRAKLERRVDVVAHAAAKGHELRLVIHNRGWRTELRAAVVSHQEEQPSSTQGEEQCPS